MRQRPRSTTAALPHIALVGSPNAGKSTLFNALTGLKVKTANYPGVTVGRSTGVATIPSAADGPLAVEIEDLPGTYSLASVSVDEQIVTDVLNGDLHGVDRPDAIVIVTDATTLERSLILVAQVMRLGLPSALCLTMHDELQARGGSISLEDATAALGIPVVAVEARAKHGADALIELLPSWRTWRSPVIAPPAPPQERDAWIASVLSAAHYRAPGSDRMAARIDRILLHPIWGSLLFFAVLFAFFQVVFVVGAPIQALIESGTSWLSAAVRSLFGDGLVASFLADALIGGVGGVLVFVPQIALLFVLIAVLEQSGYLARAAFLMDRVMRVFGLEGRAFVAMLSAFACAVPAIFATRTLPSARDRFATMMSLPLVTCSARLPVYTVMLGMLIPAQARIGPVSARGVGLFCLYLLGAGSMMVAARIVKSLTGRRDALVPFTMELPPYRAPAPRTLAAATWLPVRGFLKKVGTTIMAATIVLWVLLSFPMQSASALTQAGIDPSDSAAVGTYTLQHSFASSVGHAVEPVFEPLGFDWRVNVAVLSSLAARETFVSTLGQISAASNPDQPAHVLTHATFESGQHEGSPMFTAPTLVAILVFFVYALQCMATIAALHRETGRWRWPLLAFATLFGAAWTMAWLARAVTTAIVGAP